jgi:mono/diheme cytochrome c family protein
MHKERSRLTHTCLLLALVLVMLAAVTGWAKGKKANLTGPSKPGEKVFQQNCAMCHYADQTKTKIGPGLKGLFEMKELPYAHKPTTEANVRDQVEKGNLQGKPMPMPGFGDKLSKTDMDDLMAYLKTL